RREQGMTPYEVMLSESQERMVLVAKQGREREVLEIFHRWDLDAAVIGKVTDTGHVVITEGPNVVADIPVTPLTEGAPVYRRPMARPASLDAIQQFDTTSVPPPKSLGDALLELVARPTIASKRWVYRQYDHQVRLGGVVLPGRADAAVVRVERGAKGLALSSDCNSRFVFLDPYEGARLTVAECARNVACVGGEPLGLSDCLNFGNPEKPEVMWQFGEAVRGLADACRAMGIPVVSGNVSLYNDTDGKSIFPTPMCAIVGLLPDVSKAVSMGFKREGDVIAVLGTTTGALGGSEWLHAQGHTAGLPPRLDVEAELALHRALRKLVRGGLVQSTHDCSEGGLGVALAECCVADDAHLLGAQVTFEFGKVAPHAVLFGEDASRAVISFAPEHRDAVLKICAGEQVPCATVGTVGGRTLRISGLLDVDVAALSDSWTRGFERALGL
ncbi:MAG: phosphoribosylformylglycinamidine synthase II, partial [Archangium sp.]|nr:phosphoribosylformylglycinamidine synthase II [Archangium sp.]